MGSSNHSNKPECYIELYSYVLASTYSYVRSGCNLVFGNLRISWAGWIHIMILPAGLSLTLATLPTESLLLLAGFAITFPESLWQFIRLEEIAKAGAEGSPIIEA